MIHEGAMKTSEMFMDALCLNNGGTPCITCEFCNVTHFTHEAEGIDDLRKKAEAFPEKYAESPDDGLSFGYLDGKQFVYGCPCDAPARYEWRHRDVIAEYLKRRTAHNLKRSQEDSELAESIQ